MEPPNPNPNPTPPLGPKVWDLLTGFILFVLDNSVNWFKTLRGTGIIEKNFRQGTGGAAGRSMSRGIRGLWWAPRAAERESDGRCRLRLPCTLHGVGTTLHPTPYTTLHPTPYTVQATYTLHSTCPSLDLFYTLHFNSHSARYSLHISYILSSTLHPTLHLLYILLMNSPTLTVHPTYHQNQALDGMILSERLFDGSTVDFKIFSGKTKKTRLNCTNHQVLVHQHHHLHHQYHVQHNQYNLDLYNNCSIGDIRLRRKGR